MSLSYTDRTLNYLFTVVCETKFTYQSEKVKEHHIVIAPHEHLARGWVAANKGVGKEARTEVSIQEIVQQEIHGFVQVL